MGKYKKLPVEIEAISFEEFVQYGLNAEGANIVNGEPWHFEYQGHPVTQENATVYLIPTKEGVMNFTPQDVLITGIQGEIYPCKKDIFEATYSKIEETSNLTYAEAEKLLLKGLSIALPEWKGFWFKNEKTLEILVLTKDGEILNTPHDKYKESNEWQVVQPNSEQLKLIENYFSDSDSSLNSGNNMTFGNAVEALKKGFLVARQGWNGKGMFLFIRPSDELLTGFIPNVKSLPESVKKWIDKNIDDKLNSGESGLTPVKFSSYICMKASDNTIVNGWLASQTDILSEDWYILN